MINKKRYQVFVSSTFEDLKDERAKVMETILNYECFPAGMEMFPAMDEEQFKYIKRIIDDSDYYLLIIGGRYGSVDDEGVSWTEKEYNYAIEKGIPVMAFVIDDSAYNKLPQDKIDEKDIDKNRKKLKAFKKKVSSARLINKWTDANGLALAVAKSLKVVLELQPRIGWVRAGSVVSDDARIDQLEKEIVGYKEDIKKLNSDLARKEIDFHSIEESNNKAHQHEIKNLQKKIEELQQQYNELDAQKRKCDEDRQSFQEKVNHAACGLEEILDELKGKRTKTIYVPGTDVAFNMVYVEGGTFMMGANDDDKSADSDEKPAHKVTLSDYYIAETLVTQALWQAVMKKNPSFFDGNPNLPVEQVSWIDCQRFIKTLNKLTGKSFHLPTEAQWEFAARGGNKSKGYIYAGGDDITMVAWNEANSERKTHVVAQKTANELGLYDMSGNVWEWCQDRFGQYTTDGQASHEGSSSESNRVRRGGSYVNGIRGCRVSFRDYCNQYYNSFNLGLRLVL